MALKIKKAPKVGGITYDSVAVSLAISPVWGDTEVTSNIAVRLEPYCKDANGKIVRLENPAPVAGQPAVDYTGSIVHSPKAMNDAAFDAKIAKIIDLVQDLIAAKGL